MSRKVCDTWFYAILICSVGVSLYYYYPEVQNRFPQATAILEMHYKKITSQFVSSMQRKWHVQFYVLNIKQITLCLNYSNITYVLDKFSSKI